MARGAHRKDLAAGNDTLILAAAAALQKSGPDDAWRRVPSDPAKHGWTAPKK